MPKRFYEGNEVQWNWKKLWINKLFFNFFECQTPKSPKDLLVLRGVSRSDKMTEIEMKILRVSNPRETDIQKGFKGVNDGIVRKK